MRAAPAVRAALDGAVPEQRLIAGLHLLAGAVLAAWAWGHSELGLTWPLALALVAWLVASARLGLRLARSALPGDGAFLQWDGAGWCLGLHGPVPSATAPAELRLSGLVLALDLGPWVLLRLHPAAGGRRWQVARAACVGADWHGLRLALAAHAGHPDRSASAAA
jgi:hypothetical protein